MISRKKIENTMIHPSTAPQSKVKHKQVFTDRIYPLWGSKHQETFLTTQSATVSILYQAPTITKFFYLITSMDQLTVKIICAKIHT